jgi:hypothetical protein
MAAVCASAALLDDVPEGAVVPSPSTAKEEGVQDVRINRNVSRKEASSLYAIREEREKD